MKNLFKVLAIGLVALTMSCSKQQSGSGSSQNAPTMSESTSSCSKKEGSPCQAAQPEKKEESPCHPPKKSEPSPCAKQKSKCSSQSDKINAGQGKKLSAAQRVLQGS